MRQQFFDQTVLVRRKASQHIFEAYGPCPLSLALWIRLITAAARLPARNDPENNQLLRLWIGAHNRKNWLFSGSLAAGARAADIMSLIQTAKMNHIEPLAYLTDVLTRLTTHPNSRIEALLPTRWHPQTLAGQ